MTYIKERLKVLCVDRNIVTFILLWGLDDIIHLKSIDECLAHSKHSTNISYYQYYCCSYY